MTCVNYQNHSKNDGSTDDFMHKIIILCGLANLRCFGGWGGRCRLNGACGKYERNGFQRVQYARAALFVCVHSRPQGPSVFLSGPRKPTDGVALVTRMADVYERGGACRILHFLQNHAKFYNIWFRQVLVLNERSKLQVL